MTLAGQLRMPKGSSFFPRRPQTTSTQLSRRISGLFSLRFHTHGGMGVLEKRCIVRKCHKKRAVVMAITVFLFFSLSSTRDTQWGWWLEYSCNGWLTATVLHRHLCLATSSAIYRLRCTHSTDIALILRRSSMLGEFFVLPTPVTDSVRVQRAFRPTTSYIPLERVLS